MVGFCGYFDSETQTISPDSQRTHELALQISTNEVDLVLFRSIDWLSQPRNLNYTLISNLPAIPFTGATAFTGNTLSAREQRGSVTPFRYAMPMFGGFPDLPKLWGLTALMTYQLLFCLLPQGMPRHPLLPNPFARYH